jgi:hypothetical protein
MPKRSKQQWLEMIYRTRPSAFAVDALKREFIRNTPTDDLSESEANEVQAALKRLEVQAALKRLGVQAALERLEVTARETPLRQVSDTTDSLQAVIEYRPHGAGGKGRLFIEIEGKSQLEPLENTVLDKLQVYIMLDGESFAGLQVDNAASLPKQLSETLEALSRLELPRVDCAEAGLENAAVTDVLSWAVQHRVLAGR